MEEVEGGQVLGMCMWAWPRPHGACECDGSFVRGPKS